MSRLREVVCVAETVEEEVDPVLWEQTIDYLCRLMLEEYFRRHPQALPARATPGPINEEGI